MIKQALMSSSDPTSRAFFSRDLGNALELRFEFKDNSGVLDQGDVDKAIASYRTTIEHMPVTEPSELGEGDIDLLRYCNIWEMHCLGGR